MENEKTYKELVFLLNDSRIEIAERKREKEQIERDNFFADEEQAKRRTERELEALSLEEQIIFLELLLKEKKTIDSGNVWIEKES